jgi:hypothetical protein
MIIAPTTPLLARTHPPPAKFDTSHGVVRASPDNIHGLDNHNEINALKGRNKSAQVSALGTLLTQTESTP